MVVTLTGVGIPEHKETGQPCGCPASVTVDSTAKHTGLTH